MASITLSFYRKIEKAKEICKRIHGILEGTPEEDEELPK